jgi:hypothetical protein
MFMCRGSRIERMSHESECSLLVCDRRDSAVTGYGVSKALLSAIGVEGPLVEEHRSDLPSLRKWMSAHTRSDWLQWKSKELFDAAANFNSLRFVSEETYTHREFCPYGGEDDQDPYGADRQYTVIDSNSSAAIARDIDRFLRWCASNVPLVGDVLEDWDSSVVHGIHNAPVSAQPNYEAPRAEDGQGAEFFFSVFKTIREYLAYAGKLGLIAIYLNTQPRYLEEYRRLVSATFGGQHTSGSLYAAISETDDHGC